MAMSKVMQKMEKLQVSDRLIVAAIDFGTTFSGYAFSFRHEYEKDPTVIHMNTWEDGSMGSTGATLKTPTCLLLRPDKKLYSFGYAAKAKYEELVLDDDPDNNYKDWFFFWQFKMNLHQKKELKGNFKLKEENGKELDAVRVFSLSIQFLKEHLENTVKKTGATVLPREYTWVITVPAIWQESAKKFMRKAAERAGIDKSKLLIALEPEAASLYCRQIPMTRSPDGNITPFDVGSKYMVLDCGGGTVDITVHEILKEDKLKELHKATGGSWGGTRVDAGFLKFIKSYVGTDQYDDYRRDNKVDFLNLLQSFEAKKKSVKPDCDDLVTMTIPQSLQGLVAKQPSPSNFPGKVSLLGDKMRFEAKLFKYFFDAPTRDILQHVEELLEYLQWSVRAILMVGGFSESALLQHAVKDRFEDKLEVIIPMDPSLCVMKGAVLFGHDPTNVAERRLTYTYGVVMTQRFSRRRHPANRKIVVNGEELCDNVFDKHVEMGQVVLSKEAQPEREYFPLTDTDTILPIVLFKSTNSNPEFVDEDGCDCVGQFLVKIKDEPGKSKFDKKVKVRLVFSGTEVTAEVVEKSGKVHTADFELLE